VGETAIAKVTAPHVVAWFIEMSRSPVTKAHIKALLHRLFEKAMLWELIAVQRNPMELVKIRGSSKRAKRPLVLSVEQANGLVELIQQPYRTMVLVALCTGLRVSEVLALKWADIDLERMEMNVCRAVVRGIVEGTKTECSADLLPLDAQFAEKLQAWHGHCPPSADGWMFPSPISGRPYTPGIIQQKVIRKAEEKLGLEHVGWHTMRHTYRSMVEATGATIGVQQKLMRHADIATTSRYGNSFMDTKREVNSKVVRMVLCGC
jgi:integrase